MATPRTIVLIDGENLVFRYEAMLAEGRTPDKKITHIPGVFVWHPLLTEWALMDVARVYYYSSMVADDQSVAATRQKIANVIFKYDYDLGNNRSGTAQIVPVLFKKLSKSRKSRQVDIQITIDMMRFAHNPTIQLLYLVSGDGDYLPLLQEIMRHGKEVYLGALSSGLAPELRYTVDEFINLDDIFFPPPSAKKKGTKPKHVA